MTNFTPSSLLHTAHYAYQYNRPTPGALLPYRCMALEIMVRPAWCYQKEGRAMMQASPSPSSPQSSDHAASMEGDSSPLSRSGTVAAMARRRRKRMAIELPADQANNLNKDELKKWKNRIAAARARERTQQQVHELQGMVDRLWQENQQQKALIDHLKGVIQTLQPNYDYCSQYEQGLQAMAGFAPDPMPFPYHPQGDHQYSTSGVSAMTNGILAELGDTTWMFSSQSQE